MATSIPYKSANTYKGLSHLESAFLALKIKAQQPSAAKSPPKKTGLSGAITALKMRKNNAYSGARAYNPPTGNNAFSHSYGVTRSKGLEEIEEMVKALETLSAKVGTPSRVTAVNNLARNIQRNIELESASQSASNAAMFAKIAEEYRQRERQNEMFSRMGLEYPTII